MMGHAGACFVWSEERAHRLLLRQARLALAHAARGGHCERDADARVPRVGAKASPSSGRGNTTTELESNGTLLE